jgi:hypothetical protein
MVDLPRETRVDERTGKRKFGAHKAKASFKFRAAPYAQLKLAAF